MSYYYLEITRGNENGRRYPLPDGAVSIGRSSQNTIVLGSFEKSVSGHHLIIYKSPERIIAQDLQSTNGTYVNEIKITEKEIAPGDEIGFGKAGPRLKLIFSDVELDTAPKETNHSEGATFRTHDDTTPRASREALRAIRDIRRVDDDAPNYPVHKGKKTEDTSLTMEIGQKLADKNIDSGDLEKLMKNGKRLERLLERADLSSTQTNMLRAMYDTSRNMRRKLLYVAFVIIITVVAAAAFFAMRAFQYRHVIEKARTLKSDIAEYDKRIASVNDNPDANKENLKKLIAELETKEKAFTTLQIRIDQNDFGKFYSDPLERDIEKMLSRFGESDYHIPREMIERVRYHIGVYSGNLHDMIGRYLKRKEKYFPMIQRTFREANLPIELAYVAMLESGFNPMALSHCGARGLWQFMPATGKQFGLKQSGDIDERTDPAKATVAAAQYFKELIGIFGGKSSVMLCMAAYNAGEGRIMNALRKIDDPMRNRDFWYIYRMGYLAEETNEYIPRVIALMIISEYPKRFGFAPASADTGILETEKDFVELQLERK